MRRKKRKAPEAWKPKTETFGTWKQTYDLPNWPCPGLSLYHLDYVFWALEWSGTRTKRWNRFQAWSCSNSGWRGGYIKKNYETSHAQRGVKSLAISNTCSTTGSQKIHTFVQSLPFLFKRCHNLVMFCREELTLTGLMSYYEAKMSPQHPDFLLENKGRTPLTARKDLIWIYLVLNILKREAGLSLSFFRET